MQIILSDEEIDIIYEALITERREALIDISNDERRGRDTAYRIKTKKDIENLQKRFEPYAKRGYK